MLWCFSVSDVEKANISLCDSISGCVFEVFGSVDLQHSYLAGSSLRSNYKICMPQ